MTGLFDDDELPALNDTTFAVPLGWTADNVGKCRSCHAVVLWCVTPAGKKAPVNPDGVNHFVTCPQRDDWRRKGA